MSTKVNGITKKSLSDGNSEFNIIQEEVNNLIKEKFIITVAGKSDMDALEIHPTDDYVFDLQAHWYRLKGNKDGVVVVERFGLKKIYKCILLNLFKRIYPHL